MAMKQPLQAITAWGASGTAHCLVTAILLTGFAWLGLSVDETFRHEQIDDLIRALEADDYATREQATQQLIQQDGNVIVPLAMRYHQVGPESAWRIKRVFMEIATKSPDEANSLRAIAMIMVVDQQIDQQLASILAAWRENRAHRAVQFLVERGAHTMPSGNQPLFFAQRNQFPLGDAIWSLGETGTQNPLRGKQQEPEPPAADPNFQIGILANATTTEVQKFVFDRMARQPPVENIELLDSILVNPVFHEAATASTQFLEIGPDWQGTPDDFHRIKEIHSLTSLRFVKRTMGDPEFELISTLAQLRHLGISDITFGKKSLLKLDLPEAVDSMELEGHVVDLSTLNWLSRRSLSRLSIGNCDFNNVARAKLSQLDSVQILALRNLVVDKVIFNELVKMSNLERVYFAACKFSYQEFREFERVRPGLITFQPLGFLGVQGRRDNIRLGGVTSEIELVVPDSAADKAGLQIGDVIAAVNGNEIESFEELRMYISQHDVGETMQLKVIRSGQPLELQATLGSVQDAPPP